MMWGLAVSREGLATLSAQVRRYILKKVGFHSLIR